MFLLTGTGTECPSLHALYFLGFGGYSSRWALHLIRDIFKGCDESNTGLVTLFWGANDAARPLPEGNE